MFRATAVMPLAGSCPASLPAICTANELFPASGRFGSPVP
jgi:hypothetical protein